MHYQNACMRVDRQQLHHPSIRNTLRTEHFDNSAVGNNNTKQTLKYFLHLKEIFVCVISSTEDVCFQKSQKKP